jgi:exocyst complex component 4
VICRCPDTHRSQAWFVTELNSLKVAADEPPTPATPSIMEPLSAFTPFTPSIPQVAPLAPDDELKLPMSREMALRFQALLKTYDLLAELIICTIRVDVRCRTIYHLDLTMKSVSASSCRTQASLFAHHSDLG